MIEEKLFTRIHRVQLGEIEVLQKLAQADEHVVLGATHTVRKGQQMIGYVGLIPSVMLWLDTQRAKARDSLVVMNFIENQLRDGGSEVISIPCADNSPYHRFLPQIDYTNVGKMDLFLKNLKA